jgi:hypothetical protein
MGKMNINNKQLKIYGEACFGKEYYRNQLKNGDQLPADIIFFSIKFLLMAAFKTSTLRRFAEKNWNKPYSLISATLAEEVINTLKNNGYIKEIDSKSGSYEITKKGIELIGPLIYLYYKKGLKKYF